MQFRLWNIFRNTAFILVLSAGDWIRALSVQEGIFA